MIPVLMVFLYFNGGRVLLCGLTYKKITVYDKNYFKNYQEQMSYASVVWLVTTFPGR